MIARWVFVFIIVLTVLVAFHFVGSSSSSTIEHSAEVVDYYGQYHRDLKGKVEERKLCAPVNRKSYKRVAILFYGVSKNLKLTLPSFHKHVFGVLHKQSIMFDVFWSVLDLKGVSNFHSGERNVTSDNDHDVAMLQPCVHQVHDERKVKLNEWLLFCKARRMECGKTTTLLNQSYAKQYDYLASIDDFSSLQRQLSGYYTMVQGSKMIKKYSSSQNLRYDAVLVLRPDTAAIKDIDIAEKMFGQGDQKRATGGGSGSSSSARQGEGKTAAGAAAATKALQHRRNLGVVEAVRRNDPAVVNRQFEAVVDRQAYSLSSSEMEANQIWIPDFQHFFGCNDRAAYGPPPLMLNKYLRRGITFRDDASSIAVQGTRSAEMFTLKYLTLLHNITLRRSDFRVIRVRIGGLVDPFDASTTWMNLPPGDEDLNKCLVPHGKMEAKDEKVEALTMYQYEPKRCITF